MTQDINEQERPDAREAEATDELEVLRAEVEQLKAQSLLERADLDNQRKRLSRDLEMARKFANERLLGDLLPVLDSLQADAGSASAEGPAQALFERVLHSR